MQEKLNIYLLITDTVHYANTLHMLYFFSVLYKRITLYLSVSKVFCQLLCHKEKREITLSDLRNIYFLPVISTYKHGKNSTFKFCWISFMKDITGPLNSAEKLVYMLNKECSSVKQGFHITIFCPWSLLKYHSKWDLGYS